MHAEMVRPGKVELASLDLGLRADRYRWEWDLEHRGRFLGKRHNDRLAIPLDVYGLDERSTTIHAEQEHDDPPDLLDERPVGSDKVLYPMDRGVVAELLGELFGFVQVVATLFGGGELGFEFGRTGYVHDRWGIEVVIGVDETELPFITS